MDLAIRPNLAAKERVPIGIPIPSATNLVTTGVSPHEAKTISKLQTTILTVDEVMKTLLFFRQFDNQVK